MIASERKDYYYIVPVFDENGKFLGYDPSYIKECCNTRNGELLILHHEISSNKWFYSYNNIVKIDPNDPDFDNAKTRYSSLDESFISSHIEYLLPLEDLLIQY